MKFGLNTAALVAFAAVDAGRGVSLALVAPTLPNSSTAASEATMTSFRPLNILGLLTRSYELCFADQDYRPSPTAQRKRPVSIETGRPVPRLTFGATCCPRPCVRC